MYFIDSHTHLYGEAFDNDRDEAIKNALANNVKQFVLPAIDSTYTARMQALKKKYPDQVHLMAGLHPTHVKPDTLEKEMAHVKKRLENENLCAVGEIGIDLYWDKSTLDIQQQAFAKQIQWAKEYDLPIVIHCRDAFDEVFEVLETEKDEKLKGVFHCFPGTMDNAQKAVDHNLKLGIGGVVTFKNGKIDKFLHEIDLAHIVLETDAPYLAPAPFRGKRNESAYIAIIAQKIADIYKVPLEEVMKKTTNNCKEVFALQP